MNKYILFLLASILLIIGCKSKPIDKNTTITEKSVEEILEKAKKKNDISLFFNDSINAGRKIKEAFLTFKFGDSKSEVNRKIVNLIKTKKIIKKNNNTTGVELFGIEKFNYLYEMKFEDGQMLFALDFKYFNNELYSISLFHFKQVGSIPYWDKEKIVKLYQEKYKNSWVVNKYTPITTSYENEEYENLEGTRYISLIFTDHSLNISYTDIYLEKLMREQNLNATKDDI